MEALQLRVSLLSGSSILSQNVGEANIGPGGAQGRRCLCGTCGTGVPVRQKPAGVLDLAAVCLSRCLSKSKILTHCVARAMCFLDPLLPCNMVHAQSMQPSSMTSSSCYQNALCSHPSLSTQARSLPLSLTAWPYFCSLVIKASPCFTTSAYCLFLSSGRVVSIVP